MHDAGELTVKDCSFEGMLRLPYCVLGVQERTQHAERRGDGV